METALLLGSLLLQVRSIICDPTWSKSDPSWRLVSIFESVIKSLKIKSYYFRFSDDLKAPLYIKLLT